jgi:hypothetical protein
MVRGTRDSEAKSGTGRGTFRGTPQGEWTLDSSHDTGLLRMKILNLFIEDVGIVTNYNVILTLRSTTPGVMRTLCPKRVRLGGKWT